MPAQSAVAVVAIAAGKIDFSDNSLGNERLRSFYDAAGEFMAGDARKIHVAFENLQIGGADAGQVNFHQGGLPAADRRRVGRFEF
jgi:hypothetical protein